MLVYGKNVAIEVLNSNKYIEKIYLSDKFDDKNILSLIENRNLEVEYLSKKELSRFDKYRHQGIILAVEEFSYSEVEDFILDDAKILILDHLEDPHNFGAIIRTAEAAGITGIIIPKNRSVEVNSTVVSTSAGAIENMKIARVTNLADVIKDLKNEGFWIVGSDMDGDDYQTIDYSGKIALVIGNEGRGISSLVKESCDFIAKIPMHGKINSLNASVAAAILIYEVIKTK